MDSTIGKHEFAFFFDTLIVAQDSSLVVTDAQLIFRIKTVLRGTVGSRCILFDRLRHVYAVIKHLDKKSILFTVQKVFFNVSLVPQVTLFLPILKKDDLSDAITMSVASGASEIRLIKAQKAQGTCTRKDLERFDRLVQSVGEQVKNFALPMVYQPESLVEIIKAFSDTMVLFFCDPQAPSLFSILHGLPGDSSCKYGVIVGPEGDLTLQEKEFLRHHNVRFCALTPTVLRSSLAAGLAIGLVRNFFLDR